jgi:hypothetical protein
MIRRFLIASYAVALAILGVQFLLLTLLCLSDIVVSHERPWPFLLTALFVGFLLWFIWGELKRKIKRDDGRNEDSAKSSPVPQSPHSRRARALLSKIPGFDRICGFVRWFWHIGGLDDVKSPILLTPFGGWVMVILGSPLLVFALVIFIRTELFLHRSISADGTVIRLVADHDETVHYAPIFAFTAQNGRAMTAQSLNYSVPPEFSVGQKVLILYEKDHPERARIATHWQVHGSEELLAILGLFFAGIGSGSLIYQRRRNRRTLGSKVAP